MRRVAALALTLTAFAGCAGSSGGSDAQRPSSTSTERAAGSVESSSTTTVPLAVRDEATVRGVLLRSEDLPAWTATGEPTPPGTDELASSAEFARCLGVSNPRTVADLDSPTFTMGDWELQSDVFTYENGSVNDEYEAALTTRGTDCVGKMLKKVVSKELPAGAVMSKLDVRRTGPAIEDRGSKFMMSFVVSVPDSGVKINFSSAFTSVNIDRLGIETIVIGSDGQAPLADLERATSAQYRRATTT